MSKGIWQNQRCTLSMEGFNEDLLREMEKKSSKKMGMIIWKQLVHSKEIVRVKKVNAAANKENQRVYQQGLYT